MPLLDKILWENTTINKIIGSKMMKEIGKKKSFYLYFFSTKCWSHNAMELTNCSKFQQVYKIYIFYALKTFVELFTLQNSKRFQKNVKETHYVVTALQGRHDAVSRVGMVSARYSKDGIAILALTITDYLIFYFIFFRLALQN